jgi:hypothetical protein
MLCYAWIGWGKIVFASASRIACVPPLCSTPCSLLFTLHVVGVLLFVLQIQHDLAPLGFLFHQLSFALLVLCVGNEVAVLLQLPVNTHTHVAYATYHS